MADFVALAHIVQRRGGSSQARWRSACEPKGSLHLGTTECAFSVTKSSQPGLQLGPPGVCTENLIRVDNVTEPLKLS